MKTFIKYSCVVALIALGLAITIGWPFWAVFILLETGYGIYALRSDHPRLAKWLGVAVVIVLIGGWAWSNFKGNFPLSSATLPYGKNQVDSQIAKLMDPGLSKAKTVLALELRKKEDKLAADIPTLMQAGKHELVITQAQELIDLRKKIEKLLAQAPVPPESPAKSNVVFIVNQNEVISTLSVPDNSTVYMEADKVFCILERYGNKNDGSELSRLTIPPGKSKKYFAWGGTLRVVGLHTNTTIKLHL